MKQKKLCSTYLHMLRILPTSAFRWTSYCISGSASSSTTFLPLPAIMSTERCNKCKINLQVGYGQDRIEDALNMLDVCMPVFPCTGIHCLPIEAE